MEKSFVLKNKVIKEIYFKNAISCAEISVKIGKSFPLTAKLIDDLVKEGRLIETGYALSTGGRRPISYMLAKDRMYIISVAIDQLVTKIAILDMDNNIVQGVERFILPLAKNPHASEVLREKIKSIIEESGIPVKKFVGIGIGMPGFVDVKKGVNYSFLQLPGNKSITTYITEKTGLPVFIDNDSSIIALAENRFGIGKNVKDTLVINIGWGIGLGLILNDQLYRGYEGFAGEFSHIPIFSNGKLCWCGKVGCLETETSLLLVIEKINEGIGSGRKTKLKSLPLDDPEMAFDAIINAVREGDRFPIEILSKVGYDIGRGLAILIHILNPQKIILSGRGAAVGNILQSPIQQALHENCIPKLFQNTSIEISTLDKNAELIGAAAIVMEHYDYLEMPEDKELKKGLTV